MVDGALRDDALRDDPFEDDIVDDLVDDGDLEAPEAVAIVGMAGRFPAAANVGELWRTLLAGEENITFWDRETLRRAGVADEILDRPEHVAAKGLVAGTDQFDAEFFGLSPREAEVMDPQVRLFLETCWQAAEDAGYDIRGFGADGGGRAGVYGGSNISSYLLSNLMSRPDLVAQVGELQVRITNDKDGLATWTAYKLDLRGPCVTVQTACSTSLVAVHLASQGLLDGECDLALAGGVGLSFPLEQGYFYQEGGILSADGHCRPFDAAADGTVPGTGVAVVALRRLSDALADGDTIRAVILGTAISNDGSRKAGYTAPGVEGQMRAIAEALSLADVDPATVGYVEAHGSGTRLGDPIEVDALTRAFRRHTDRRGFCALGSVKANLGHLDSAAGVTGLIKTVCALEAGQIPPMLHFERPNPALRLDESPFYVPTEAREWPAFDGQPRRGGVSSFGIGGTNVHAVVEEAPETEPGSASRTWQPLVVSARSATALDAACERLADHLENNADEALPDVAFTLAMGRHPFDHRRAVVARDLAGAVDLLRAGASRRRVAGRVRGDDPGVAFLLPGVGDHHPGMGRALYDTEPVVRQVVDEAAEILRTRCDFDLLAVLYPAETEGQGASGGPDLKAMLRRQQGPASAAEQELDVTRRAHPAIFVVEVALARLLMSWGIVPRAMIGYSLGEYVAAHLAGVMEFEDALVLVAERARVIDELPEGAMLAVPLSAEALAPWLENAPGLALSAVNGDALSVVGGERGAIEALGQKLEAEGVACRELRSRHPFHTPLMEPARQALAEGMAHLALKAPEIPFLSNVTGTWITAEQAMDPEYWSRHLVETVRFTDGLAELLGDEAPALLEVGPGKALTTLARQHPRCGKTQPVITTLGDRWDGLPADEALTCAVAGLWARGAGPDWKAWYGDERRLRRPLPTYPFEGRRFWIEPGEPVAEGASSSALAGQPAATGAKNAELGEWFYLPSWRRLPPRSQGVGGATLAGPVLLFDDGSPLGEALATELTAAGVELVRALAGESWVSADTAGEPFRLRPGERQDHGALLDELTRRHQMPRNVLHLWSLPAGPDTGDPAGLVAAGDRLLDHGFYSLLYLAQALGERPPVEGGTQIAVIASQLWQVRGDESLCPPKAALFGPAQVIPQESPQVDCRCFELAAGELPAPDDVGAATALARRLLTEMADDPATAEPRIALRGRYRWAGELEGAPMASPPRPVSRLQRQGAFLITSCDGTGLAVAEHLAQVAEARLVVLDDGSSPSETTRAKTRERLANLASRGEVATFEVDWNDPGKVEAVLAEARGRLGGLDGIFHTAAVPDAGLIQLKTRSLAAPVLAPKVAGTLALLRACESEPPGFLVLYSASAAWLGGVGQVDHAAANAVLGAVAQDRARRSNGDPVAGHTVGHTVAIAWDTFRWEGEAQGAGLSEAMARQLEENLERFGIDAEEHVELLDRVLASDLDQVVVSGRRFRQVVREMEAMKSADLYAQIAGSELAPAHQRPELETEYRAPSNPTEETLAQLWSEAFGIDRVGVDDDFFDLEGNSLMAVQIVTRLRTALDVDLAMGALFEAPTIAQLAEQVDARRAEALAAADGDDGAEDDEDELARLLAEVENLSPEEAEALLAEEGEP